MPRTHSTWARSRAWVGASNRRAAAKLYTARTAITAADLLNDRVLRFFEQEQLPLLRILTDRGTEFCGRHDEHPYQLFLAVNGVDDTKTKAKIPQTNGICERFHKTVLQKVLPGGLGIA